MAEWKIRSGKIRKSKSKIEILTSKRSGYLSTNTHFRYYFLFDIVSNLDLPILIIVSEFVLRISNLYILVVASHSGP